MKITDQVCSLELAKRLKELGVRQESTFYWTEFYYTGGPAHYDLQFHGHGIPSNRANIVTDYSAFTVAELGKMLPPDTPSDKSASDTYRCWMQDSEDGDTWYCEHFGEEEWTPEIIHADTEADARAKMLIYLIEKGIVKP